jgi:hypothetical protein
LPSSANVYSALTISSRKKFDKKITTLVNKKKIQKPRRTSIVLDEFELAEFDKVCTTYGVNRTTAIRWLVQDVNKKKKLPTPNPPGEEPHTNH